MLHRAWFYIESLLKKGLTNVQAIKYCPTVWDKNKNTKMFSDLLS